MDHEELGRLIEKGIVEAVSSMVPEGLEHALKQRCVGGRLKHPITLRRHGHRGDIFCPDCKRIMATGDHEKLHRFFVFLRRGK